MADKINFLKPGEYTSKHSEINDLRLEKSIGMEGMGSAIFYNPFINQPLEKQKRFLPVFNYKNQILHLIENYQTLIIIGETGSGKTTQIPQYLYDAGWANNGYAIGITQPRRVAAISIATRVAEEMNCLIGTKVGYSIRFDDKCSQDETKIKFITDGHLIREMMYDPLLTKYSVIILDEVHERNVNTDIIMSLMKKILKKRPELRVIISSATIDPMPFKKFFNLGENNRSTSIILGIEGRVFPIDIFYLQCPCPQYVDTAIKVVKKIHHNEEKGDILVFLTGQDEINYAVNKTKEYTVTNNLNEVLFPLPMHSKLTIQEQLKVFQASPFGTRKVIYSTNVSETSITIHNISYVIDCGLHKMNYYDLDEKLDLLVITKISKHSANQRAGRAGRSRNGKVYRLYSEVEFEKFDDQTLPEIQRCHLAPVILQLKALGVDNLVHFGFFSSPSSNHIADGLQLLYALKIIDDRCKLTEPLGVSVAEFPLDPMVSKMLYASGDFGCSLEICLIAAFLQIENIYSQFPHNKRDAEKSRMMFAVKEGDLITFINIYRAFLKSGKNSSWCRKNFLNYKALMHVENINNHLLNLLKYYKIQLISSKDDDLPIRKCIASSFFSNVAKFNSAEGHYVTLTSNKKMHIHPLSVLCYDVQPSWIIYTQVISQNKNYLKDITVIDPLWLCDLAPHYYQYGTEREINSKNIE